MYELNVSVLFPVFSALNTNDVLPVAAQLTVCVHDSTAADAEPMQPAITSMAIMIAAAVLFVNLRFAVFFAFIIIFSPFFFGLNALRLPAGFSGGTACPSEPPPFLYFPIKY